MTQSYLHPDLSDSSVFTKYVVHFFCCYLVGQIPETKPPNIKDIENVFHVSIKILRYDWKFSRTRNAAHILRYKAHE